ncbi:MAG: hypothetical protein GY788_12865 [bacterium]|nr:hypothetical protein [bacterium]
MGPRWYHLSNVYDSAATIRRLPQWLTVARRLMAAASTLPLFFLALAAGATADMFDKLGGTA